MSEVALYALLTAGVGTSPATSLALLISDRIFPGVAPTMTLRPYVTYSRIVTARVRSVKGPSHLAAPRYQVDAWGDTAQSAKQVQDAIRTLLDGFRGSIAGVRVKGIICDDEGSDQDPESGLFRSRAEYILWHNE